jgi:hypothetical protein
MPVRREEAGAGEASGRALPDLALSLEGADYELSMAGTSPGVPLGGHPDRRFVGAQIRGRRGTRVMLR